MALVASAVRSGIRIFLGAPAVVLIYAIVENTDWHFDCSRAGQNLSLAAHSRGFGVCWLGAPSLGQGARVMPKELVCRRGSSLRWRWRWVIPQRVCNRNPSLAPDIVWN